MPTPIEHEKDVLRALEQLPDIPSEIPVKNTIDKLRLMEPHTLFGINYDAIPPVEPVCQRRMLCEMWETLVPGDNRTTSSPRVTSFYDD